MNDHLLSLYKKIQSSPVITACLPSEFGEGSITRISTPRGFSISTWKMKYNDNTSVEGQVGKDVRLLFCHGNDTEWETDRKNRAP